MMAYAKTEEGLYRQLLGSLGGMLVYDPEYSAAYRRSLEYEADSERIKRPKHAVRFLRMGEGVTIYDLIMLAYRRDLGYTWFCVGQRGSGKTTLSALLLYSVYGSWDVCRRHIIYDLEELDALKEYYSSKGGKAPLVVFDDAAMHLHNRRSWDPDIREFVRAYATIREWFTTVLFVTHDIEAVDSALRRDINGILFPANAMDVFPVPDSRLGGKRIALFSLIKSVPDFRDPLRSFRYRIPIHSLDSPIIFHDLPPEVKAYLVAKKKASTDRVDMARVELAISDKEVLSDLRLKLHRGHEAVLKIMCKLDGDAHAGHTRFKPIEILRYISESDDEDAAVLKGATENMIHRYLRRLAATTPAMVLGDSLNGYFVTRQGRAYIETITNQGKELE